MESIVGVSTTGWWVAGSVAGALAVVVAAALVLTVIALARRIVVQAREIETALMGAHRNTESLFDIAMMNHALESITRGVKQARGEEGAPDERGLLARIASRVLPWGMP
jgi:hypothetical protein